MILENMVFIGFIILVFLNFFKIYYKLWFFVKVVFLVKDFNVFIDFFIIF